MGYNHEYRYPQPAEDYNNNILLPLGEQFVQKWIHAAVTGMGEHR